MKTLLVCDDDQDILDLIEIVFSDEDIKVVCEVQTAKIFEIINKGIPDLILLDLWMPFMSGEKVLEILKRDEKTKHIPVIMFSASNAGKDIASTAGADAYIAKPFDISELKKLVMEHLYAEK